MRIVKYDKIHDLLLTKNIVRKISLISEYKGKQALFIEVQPDILNKLLEVAKIQSAKFSNQIEGIYTTDKRLKSIVEDKAEPRNRSESEISGYRDVLELIHENYEYMPLSANLVLQLHKELYKYSSSGIGGVFKNTDNVIIEKNSDGSEFVRFKPVSPYETPDAIELICNKFNEEIKDAEKNPLILVSVFILDFLCIHPFNDGNGRMSRLLTLLLLYQNGYIVGKYISIEMLIEKTKEDYYDCLYKSSIGWNESDSDYSFFVQYYLSIILASYIEFSDRVEYVTNTKLTKTERIEKLFDNNIGRLSKRDILEKCPDISQITVERTLSTLIKEEKIIKIGSGKNTSYIRNRI